MKRWMAFWMLGVGPCLAATWIVAPTGNDRGQGTPELPLRSLGEALRRAATRSKGDAEIILKPGRYDIVETCRIGPEHAAGDKGMLGIRGEAGAVLSGFRAVPAGAWTRPDAATLAMLRPAARDHVLSLSLADVGEGDPGHLSRRGFNVAEKHEPPPALLFVKGHAMPLASWPDEGVARPGKIIDPGPTRDGEGREDFYKRGGTFGVETDRLTAWAREKDLWVDGVFGNDWEWSFNRIHAVDPAKRTITLEYGEVSGLLDKEWLKPQFRVTNALSGIGMPGDVWYDYAGRRLLFYPPEPGGSWKTAAALTWTPGPLLKVDGAQGVRIEGLILGGARDGLVEIHNSREIELRGLQFGRNAGDGLVADGPGLVLRDCRFDGCGGRGAFLSGGDETRLTPSGQVVEHCVFSHNAWWSRVFQPSLELRGVGQVVRACTFGDLPHMAIELKGNDFVIEHNIFRRITTEFRDMGAVYFNLGENPLRRGSVVRNNFFDDIRGADGKRCAVYLDNATMGVRVEGNLFRKIGRNAGNWTVMVHGGGYNQVRNNVFLDCPSPCTVSFLFATWAADWLPGYEKGWREALGAPDALVLLRAYPEVKGFAGEDHVHPPGIVFEGNVTLYSGTAPQNAGLRVEGGTPEHVRAHGNLVLPSTADAIENLRPVPGLPETARQVIERWRGTT